MGPFEVEQEPEGFTDAAVLQLRAADIEDEALHSRRVLVRNFVTNDPTVPHRWYVIGGGPAFGCAFLPIIKVPGLERLQGDGVVAVVIEIDVIEVVETAIHREVLAPVVLYALIADRAAGLDLFDAVWATAQRRFEAARSEFLSFPPMLRQHWHLPEDHRQFAIASVLEIEAHPPRAFRCHFLHIGVVGAVLRGTLAHKGFEGEHHLLGLYRPRSEEHT